MDYLPFGAERINQKITSFDTHFTYTDQEKDAESGLLYYGARYYDPVIGRFTQPDPSVVMLKSGLFAYPQYLNPYTYALNNPLKNIDPNGKNPLEVMGGGIVGSVQAAWGTVQWVANAFVLNPIGTAGPTVAMLENTGQGIRDFAADPIGEGSKRAIQIGGGVTTAGEWYWNASDYERGKVLGGVVEKIGEAYVGARLFNGLRAGGAVDDVARNPIWTSTKERSSVQNALEHWQKHRQDFPDLENAKQYVEKARDFFNNPPSGTTKVIRPNGDAVLYDIESNTLGVMNREGVPRTFYRPNANYKK